METARVMKPIQMVDLVGQYQRIKSEVDGEPEPAVVNSTDTPHTARQPEKSATRR